MTVVGVVGLGKLGLPVAVTLALRGHRTLGFDIDPGRMSLDALAAHERGIDGTGSLRQSLPGDLALSFVDRERLLREADCVLVAVETPHGPGYEGTTPLGDARADFDYGALLAAVDGVVAGARPGLEIGVMSTVMPGTTRRLIAPRTGDHTLVYCPQFVAMGTVAHDLTRPEFVLLGCSERGAGAIGGVLSRTGPAPVHAVGYESAEFAKVVYNTFVSMKVAVSNVIQQFSHEVGASAAAVFDVIRSADRRLVSDAYLGPGMGDGGPCHPRDNIALSWLARELGVADDLFTAVMASRERYVQWLAERFAEAGRGLPLVVLGTAYKPGTDITTGSSVLLMTALLRARALDVHEVGVPAELDRDAALDRPAAYFVGCPEPEFLELKTAPGSVIVDPWHRVEEREGTRVLRVGEAPAP
jgi:UDPglucose 6-dehydrogenase